MTAFSNSADFSLPAMVKSPADAYDCIIGRMSLHSTSETCMHTTAIFQVKLLYLVPPSY